MSAARSLTIADVYEWSNLLLAWRRAARGKRGSEPVARFEITLEDHLLELQDELRREAYLPGRYDTFLIREPKRRLISAAPFRDRVVHHALCNVIEPLFERRFIDASFANRAGKGTHRALDRAQALARRYRYVLPCDVRQHFASIDHAILRATLRRVIADPGILRLCDRILASGAGVLRDEYDMIWFPGDELLAALRPRGLPIGNLTSQFWSNVYLDPFDQFVKRELRCRGYLRYADDFLLFADDKATLRCWRGRIVERLARLRLTLHEARCQPRPVANGIPWLGFVVHPTHRRVKRRKVVAFRRWLRARLRAYRAGAISFGELDATVRGWVEYVRHADTWGLRRAVLRDVRLGPPVRRPVLY